METNRDQLKEIESRIYLMRGQRVMLDFDLSELYQVPTKQLNQQVKRNLYRFPPDFMFSLSIQEVNHLRSQFVTSSLSWGGRRTAPLAFTEQGVAMLSSVLKSRTAAEVNIAIMRAFVQMRQVLISNKDLEFKLQEIELKLERHDGEIKLILDAIRKLMSIRSLPHKKIVGLGKGEQSDE